MQSAGSGGSETIRTRTKEGWARTDIVTERKGNKEGRARHKRRHDKKTQMSDISRPLSPQCVSVGVTHTMKWNRDFQTRKSINKTSHNAPSPH